MERVFSLLLLLLGCAYHLQLIQCRCRFTVTCHLVVCKFINLVNNLPPYFGEVCEFSRNHLKETSNENQSFPQNAYENPTFFKDPLMSIACFYRFSKQNRFLYHNLMKLVFYSNFLTNFAAFFVVF